MVAAGVSLIVFLAVHSDRLVTTRQANYLLSPTPPSSVNKLTGCRRGGRQLFLAAQIICMALVVVVVVGLAV